eukprot:CAMPEP_0202858598 /NCGR_PEP_ID=MMETSP1391-20130828/1058_1 /ASSEMBLY_ACC=CAM_ASM_000867 /TAXON_ID=1034604 /ORGANISM="Chlamydomonas leiostraca, Strain SAG 11-49" /LENGTH=274 /DNA_ID=CAMNT_0049537527 /DNA_START=189 /DNA_END=1013 /DNA_ORIENTATION=+
MAREKIGLGTVEVHRSGTGNSIWPHARQLAGRVLKTDPDSITILSVVSGEEHISMATASNLPVSQLASNNGVVLVEAPLDVQPAWEQRVGNLDEQLRNQQQSHNQLQQSHDQLQQSHDQLQQSNNQLLQSHNQLQQSHNQLQQSHNQLLQSNNELLQSHNQLLRRANAIAMRALMDKARTKLNGGQELSSEEKQRWNTRIQQMSDAELGAAGLTMQQAQLTMYGRRTLQGQGSSAAHDVSIEEMANAVTCFGADHRQLFIYVHGEEPDQYVFDD